MSLFSLEWWQIALLFLPALLNLWGIWHAFNHTFETPLERVLWMVASSAAWPMCCLAGGVLTDLSSPRKGRIFIIQILHFRVIQ